MIRLVKICDLDLFVLKLISKQLLLTQQKGESKNFLCQNYFEKLEITPQILVRLVVFVNLVPVASMED